MRIIENEAVGVAIRDGSSRSGNVAANDESSCILI